jgi:hypothetical protein
VDAKVENSTHYKIRNFVICTNYNKFKKKQTKISSGGNTKNAYMVLVAESPRKVDHIEHQD